MTGTNHALTGALIGGVIASPIIALPVAFASHFLLDALPHYGEKAGQRKKLFKTVVAVDGILLFTGVIIAITSQQLLPALSAIAAISPDFFWIYRYIFKEKWGTLDAGPKHPFNAWHANIQRYERRWGLLVEVPVLLLLFLLNLKFTL